MDAAPATEEDVAVQRQYDPKATPGGDERKQVLVNGRVMAVPDTKRRTTTPRLFQGRSVGEAVRARLRSGAERPPQPHQEEHQA